MKSDPSLFVVVSFIVTMLMIVFLFARHSTLPDARDPETRQLKRQIESLLASLGKPRPPIQAGTLQVLYAQEDYPAMLGWIKNSMKLDLKVGLRVVSQPTSATPPMCIEIPSTTTPFGTPEFRRMRVVVNARKDLLDTKPFSWIVAGFAHELSHVVLFSIGHALKDNEKAVDLTAMILGYREFMLDSEYIFQQTKYSIGYLTSRERQFAYDYLSARE